MAPTNNEPIASGTATDTEHVSNIDPALASELDLPPSPAKDHHNHTDDAEGESEVEAEDERDQLGNESEISSPPTPSPPPPSTRKTAPSTSSDKDKGTSGTPAKITRVFQACEHCKKRKCRVSWDFFLCNLCSFFFRESCCSYYLRVFRILTVRWCSTYLQGLHAARDPVRHLHQTAINDLNCPFV